MDFLSILFLTVSTNYGYRMMWLTFHISHFYNENVDDLTGSWQLPRREKNKAKPDIRIIWQTSNKAPDSWGKNDRDSFGRDG